MDSLFRLKRKHDWAPRLGRQVRNFALASVAVAGMCFSVPAWGITQLGLIVDGSGSISNSDFNTFIDGIAGAVGQIRTDSSVEVTIVQFSTGSVVEQAPLLIDSEATRNSLVNTILDIDQIIAGTNYESAFNTTFGQLQSSSSFGLADTLTHVNMLTDGVPLISDTPGTTAFEGAELAANALVAAGVDTISFEGVGLNSFALNTLLSLARPSPGVLAPPFPDPITSNGFVTSVDTFEDVETALLAKLDAIGVVDPVDPVDPPDPSVGAIPEPVTATLGLMALSACAIATTRRSAAA